MTKLGVCCLFCYKKDQPKAIFHMVMNIIIGNFLISNWLIWSSVAYPPTPKPLMALFAMIFKFIIFVIVTPCFVWGIYLLYKYGKNYTSSKAKCSMYTFGKFVYYANMLKLLALAGLFCLTSIPLENAANDLNGIEGLGAFFLVSCLVLISCTALCIWCIYMGFQIMKYFESPFSNSGIKHMTASSKEKEVLKVDSETGLNKNQNVNMKNPRDEDVTKADNNIDMTSQGEIENLKQKNLDNVNEENNSEKFETGELNENSNSDQFEKIEVGSA